MWPSEVTFTRTPRSTHLPDAHARRVASPGSATAGEGEEDEEEEHDDDGRRSSATESDHDDPYSPKAGEAPGEAEISAELDANEYEDRQSTWVRVSTALPPRNPSSAQHTSLAPPLRTPPLPRPLACPTPHCADVRRLQQGRHGLHGRGKQ